MDLNLNIKGNYIMDIDVNDRITLSEIPGVGKVAKVGDVVIARALESSNNEEEKLVKCVTKFTL